MGAIEIRADDRGRLPNMPPPAAIEHEEIRAAVEAWQAAQLTASTASHDAFRLSQERSHALEKDNLAAADAIEAGRADPGQKNTDAADRLIANANRKAAATEIVAGRALDSLRVVIDRDAGRWAVMANDRLDAARRKWTALLDEVAVVGAELSEATAVASYTEFGRWKPGAHANQVPLRRGGGNTASLTDVIFGLAALAAPPAPRPPAAQGAMRGDHASGNSATMMYEVD